MLIDAIPAMVEKRLCLVIRSEGLRAVLGGLLEQWQFHLLAEAEPDDLVLAQEGCCPPADSREVLWLSSSRYESRHRLCLPISPEELWRTLENRFHKPPRNHIRMTVELDAAVLVRGERTISRLASLSDKGGRFFFPRELANGEELALELVLDGRSLRLDGRVIYVVPRGELAGTTTSEVGAIFDRTVPETRQQVRDYILTRYLDMVRLGLPEPLFCAGLDFFQLSPEVRRRLGCVP